MNSLGGLQTSKTECRPKLLLRTQTFLRRQEGKEMDGRNIFGVSKCPTDFSPFHLHADIQDDRSACALSQHTACQVSETSAEQNNSNKKKIRHDLSCFLGK